MFWINEYRGLVGYWSPPTQFSRVLTGHDSLGVLQASFFDVPLHNNFWHASKAGSKYDLRKILDNTVMGLQPKDAVTFVDNHE